MTDMERLAEFVLAQIADDEAAARAATPGPWELSDVHEDLADVWAPGPNMVTSAYDYPCCTAQDAAHIARHDPARVLAECAAKRAIVELHERLEDVCEICMQYDRDDNVTSGWWPCLTLRLLAQPYADRPGWDPAWKVET